MIMFAVLMWIGGGAQSTAGGVKVNTFAVMLLNLRSMLRGSDRVEVFHRELSHSSIRRANTTVLLSIAALGLSIFIMNMLEPEVPLRSVFFECIHDSLDVYRPFRCAYHHDGIGETKESGELSLSCW